MAADHKELILKYHEGLIATIAVRPLGTSDYFEKG